MSVTSLKKVELTHEVTNLDDVPYLTFGQEIQSKRNLIRYHSLVSALAKKKADIAEGKNMPLKHSSYVNILVDDPEMDFYSPKFITYPKTGSKVNRFGNDLDQLQLDIEHEFVSIIKRIRSELNIEGSDQSVDAGRLGIGAGKTPIPLDPREPKAFITTIAEVLKLNGGLKADGALNTQNVGGVDVISYDISLPYFH